MKRKFGVGLVSSASVVLSASLAVAQSSAETEDGAADAELVSLLDEAPKAYFGFKRMPKYFSDPNMNSETLNGSLLERQYLLGSLYGTRSRMAEKR